MGEENNVFNIPTIPKNYVPVEQRPVIDVPPENFNNNDDLATSVANAVGENVAQVQVAPETTQNLDNGNIPVNDTSNDIDLTTLMSNESTGNVSSEVATAPVNTPESVPQTTQAALEQPNKEQSTQDVSPSQTSEIVAPPEQDTNVVVADSLSDNENIAPFIKNTEPDGPISLGNIATLPDSLDQNYGVIADPNEPIPPTPIENNTVQAPKEKKTKEPKVKKEKVKKEKVPKEPKENGKSKKGLLIVLIIFLALFGTFGYFGYRFFFTLNPVTELTNKLRDFGADADNYLQNNDSFRILKSNDGVSFTGEATVNNDKITDYSFSGEVLKKENKFNLNLSVNENNSKKYNVYTTLLDNAFFLKMQDAGYNYRLTSDNELNIDELINNGSFKKTLNHAASVIEKNIKKDDFSSRLMRIKPNDKVIFVNKYSLKISGNKVKDIIKEIIDTEEDENVKILLERIDYSSIPEKEIDVDIYISLKKLERITISTKAHNIIITINSDNDYIVKYDSDTIEYKISNDEINIIKNDKDKITYKITNDGVDNSGVITISYSSLVNDTSTSLEFKSTISKDDRASVLVPFGIKDYESEDGKISFENEQKDVLKDDDFVHRFIDILIKK